MPRILVVSFSVCPAPDRDGVELLNLLKALAPRHLVDVLVMRGGDQPFIERLHRARMLRVPVGGGRLAERMDAFRRAVRRQLEGEEYDVLHVRSPSGAGAVVERMPPSAKLCYE